MSSESISSISCSSSEPSEDIDIWMTPGKMTVDRFDMIMDTIRNLKTKHVRKILGILNRNSKITPDHFITDINMTVGEFCTAYVLRNKEKRLLRKKNKQN